MPDFSKLIFLPLDIPRPPDISDVLDSVAKLGPDGVNMVGDDYRISPSVILTTPQGEWLPIVDQIPEFARWAHECVFSWTGLSQMVVITTPPGKSMAPHIDCSPERFVNTLQHKFRYVIRGHTDTLRYLTDGENHLVPKTDDPYLISGKWPHDMTNTYHLAKYTLCVGAPWEPTLDDPNYLELVTRSYEKNQASYMGYDSWQLPANFRTLFNTTRYGIVPESVNLQT